MKAYLLEKPQTLLLKEKSIPEPMDHEVLIRVSNVGICGSDIHLYKGSYNGPKNYPMLFGHEWSGVVVQTGNNVAKVKVGDKVTGDCSRYCGTCIACMGDKNLCKSIEKFGITIDGASAEYIVRNEQYVYKANPDDDLELLALSEPIAVARHLINKVVDKTDDIRNKKILIYGGGAIGQVALLLLKKQYGCSDVDLSDLVENRTKLAEQFGANIPNQKDLIWDMENNYYNMYNKTIYDIIIETTGVAAVFNNSLNLLKPLGILGCVGMIGEVTIPQKLIVTKSLTIIGSIGGTGEFDEVISFIHNNKTDVKKLISHRFKAMDIDQAFSVAVDVSSAMKISIEL